MGGMVAMDFPTMQDTKEFPENLSGQIELCKTNLSVVARMSL
jgi:hypothetical protein